MCVPLKEQFDIFTLNDISASEIRTYLAEISSLSELNTLPTEPYGLAKTELDWSNLLKVRLSNSLNVLSECV